MVQSRTGDDLARNRSLNGNVPVTAVMPKAPITFWSFPKALMVLSHWEGKLPMRLSLARS